MKRIISGFIVLSMITSLMTTPHVSNAAAGTKLAKKSISVAVEKSP